MNVVKLQRIDNHGTVQARMIIPVFVYEQIPDVKQLIVSYNEEKDIIECIPVR